MASPPLTNREYAYLRITSDEGDHSVVTSQLGIEPTNAWNAGDMNPGGKRKRKIMSWQYESGLDDRHDIEEHIVELFKVFEPLSQQLQQLSAEFDICIQCVGYFPPSGHGIHIDRDFVVKAAKIGASFDLDFYYISDNGHDLDYV